MERSKLVCTENDMTNSEDKLQIKNIVDRCTKERVNTKWRLYKLTKITDFAALPKAIPMGCEDAVIHDPLLENHIENCLTFERNTRQPYKYNLCLASHLHGNDKLKEATSKVFNLFLFDCEEGYPSNF